MLSVVLKFRSNSIASSKCNAMQKRIYLIILLLTCCCKFLTAQIICIYCYDQNNTISGNANNLLLN